MADPGDSMLLPLSARNELLVVDPPATESPPRATANKPKYVRLSADYSDRSTSSSFFPTSALSRSTFCELVAVIHETANYRSPDIYTFSLDETRIMAEQEDQGRRGDAN